MLPQPPEEEDKPLVWPYWPTKLRTSSSHEEGCERDWSVATKRFEGKNGKVEKLIACRLEWKEGKMAEVPNSEFEMNADLVLLAMGFISPVQAVVDAFGGLVGINSAVEFLVPMETRFFVDSEASRPHTRMIESLIRVDRERNSRKTPAVE